MNIWKLYLQFEPKAKILAEQKYKKCWNNDLSSEPPDWFQNIFLIQNKPVRSNCQSPHKNIYKKKYICKLWQSWAKLFFRPNICFLWKTWRINKFRVKTTFHYLFSRLKTSCQGILRAKKELIMLFWPILGHFWCPVVTLVNLSSNLSNFE